MSKKIKAIITLFVLIGLVGCATTSGTQTIIEKSLEGKKTEDTKVGQSMAGTLLIIMERNEGTENFTTRLFVNDDYMHVSTSISPSDFILFNRAEQTIYNVTNDDRTIFVIRKKDINVESPIELDYQEEFQPSGAIPKVDGKQATHYKYTANGKHCYDTIVMPDNFMPDVLAAMREFRLVLAGEYATTVNRTPRELLDACDLSVNIFYATKHMDHGLPIREWDRHGYQRFLKDYRLKIEPPEGMFDLPKDFEQYAIGDALVGNGN